MAGVVALIVVIVDLCISILEFKYILKYKKELNII